MKIKTILTAVFTATLLLEGSRLMAQDSTPAPATATPAATTTGSSPSDRFAEFRQRMHDRVKTMLKASDDEWSVIQPLLDKVGEDLTAQRALTSMRFGGGGGRRGGGPGGSGGNNAGGGAPGGVASGGGGAGGGGPFGRVSAPEVDGLRTVLDSDSSTVDDIKTKLQSLRDARKKADANLEQSREDLKKVLTLRQEAVLVEMGVLD